MVKNTKEYFRPVEYKMPKELADTIWRERKGDDLKKNKNKLLCDYVNNELNILGNCVNVILF